MKKDRALQCWDCVSRVTTKKVNWLIFHIVCSVCVCVCETIFMSLLLWSCRRSRKSIDPVDRPNLNWMWLGCRMNTAGFLCLYSCAYFILCVFIFQSGRTRATFPLSQGCVFHKLLLPLKTAIVNSLKNYSHHQKLPCTFSAFNCSRAQSLKAICLCFLMCWTFDCEALKLHNWPQTFNNHRQTCWYTELSKHIVTVNIL